MTKTMAAKKMHKKPGPKPKKAAKPKKKKSWMAGLKPRTAEVLKSYRSYRKEVDKDGKEHKGADGMGNAQPTDPIRA